MMVARPSTEPPALAARRGGRPRNRPLPGHRGNCPGLDTPISDKGEQSTGSGCLSVQEVIEGSVCCPHEPRHRLPSNQERLSLQARPRTLHPDPTAPPPYEDPPRPIPIPRPDEPPDVV